MNYIITKTPKYFENIGKYNYCNLPDMILPKVIAFDSETTGLVARHEDIFCVQIGTGKNNYIIHMYDNNYTFHDVIPYLMDRTLIGHNLLFDLGFGYKYNFYPKDIRDTMLASKILYNGCTNEIVGNNGRKAQVPYRHDFGSMMQRELGITYNKAEQKNISVTKLSNSGTIQYSFDDVDRLKKAHEVIMSKIKAQGFLETYNLHCRYIRALAYMEQCGMPLSAELWTEKMKVDLKSAELNKILVEEYIFDNIPKFRDPQIDMFDTKKRLRISLTSPLQMVRVFNSMGIATKDKDGKDSINESIISKSDHEFVKSWLKFQEANHRVTTFGDKILTKIEDDRVYTNFNPMVDTARLSTRKGGINFLNFPSDKETRSCFKAKPGNKIIVCDYSGQETVLAADLSGDESMTASVVNGDCLHCMFARILNPELQNLSDKEIIENHKNKRQAAKAPRFAFQYGGSAFTIHVNQGIPMKEAEAIEKGFKLLHKGLFEWGEKVFQESINTGYIESVDGWKLELPDFDTFTDYKDKVEALSLFDWTIYKEGKKEYAKWKKSLEPDNEPYKIKFQDSFNFYKENKIMVSNFFKLKSSYMRLCLNNPVQTTGAHQIKLATILLFDWILENGYINKILIVNSVHDELVVEAPENLAEIAREQVEKAMLEAGNHYLTNLKIKADAAIGNSWGEAK